MLCENKNQGEIEMITVEIKPTELNKWYLGGPELNTSAQIIIYYCQPFMVSKIKENMSVEVLEHTLI